jgi:hypothetical protein
MLAAWLLALFSLREKEPESLDALAEVAEIGPIEEGELPVVIGTWKQREVQPDQAARLYVQVIGEPVPCEIEVSIDQLGRKRGMLPGECPEALLRTARQAMEGWEFYPPTQGEVAVDTTHRVRFVYVSNTVQLPSEPSSSEMLVRVLPVAVPLWPQDPMLGRKGKRILRNAGLDSLVCSLSFVVDDRQIPAEVEILDCPAPVAEQVLGEARRWGFEVRGATKGDGTRYRLDLLVSLPE